MNRRLWSLYNKNINVTRVFHSLTFTRLNVSNVVYLNTKFQSKWKLPICDVLIGKRYNWDDSLIYKYLNHSLNSFVSLNDVKIQYSLYEYLLTCLRLDCTAYFSFSFWFFPVCFLICDLNVGHKIYNLKPLKIITKKVLILVIES